MIEYCPDITDYGHVVSVIKCEQERRRRREESKLKKKVMEYERYKQESRRL